MAMSLAAREKSKVAGTASWHFQRRWLLISIIAYALSFALPAAANLSGEVMPGWLAFYVTLWALFIGTGTSLFGQTHPYFPDAWREYLPMIAVGCVWMANPLYWYALAKGVRNERTAVLWSAAGASVIGIAPLVMSVLRHPDAHALYLGYYVWLVGICMPLLWAWRSWKSIPCDRP